MSQRLLIAWIALLGATRIDLLAGEGPFVLTPFLVLSPFVFGAEVWRTAREGWRPRVPPATSSFLLAVSALLSLLLISTFLAYDVGTSARRFLLLLVQVSFVLAIGVALANRPDPRRLLVQGALWGLGVCLVFSAAQLVATLTPLLDFAALGGILDLEARRYFGIIPRLTGSHHDANLGAFLIFFYLALVWLLAAPSRVRSWALGVGIVLLLLTLSRSAVLGALVFWALWSLERGRFRAGLRLTGALVGVLALVTALAIASPQTLEPVVETVEILGQRLNPDEGSTVQHLAILGRGLEVGTESVKHVLVGLGYGNAFVALQDYFPGNEYGNFHSLFLTIFAEAGILAAVLVLWIFVHAFLRAGPYQPLVAALFVFNLFQQAHADPWMWVILFLAWVGVGTEGARKSEFMEPGPESVGVDAPLPRA